MANNLFPVVARSDAVSYTHLDVYKRQAYNNKSDNNFCTGESNGDPSSPPPSLIFPATTSPPFMMYPGLPGEFIPPPPLVSAPFSPDSRPPPLGRISSPQLDPRFSPPPPLPYSPYDFPYGGHHSPSPPPPLPQHRTVHKPQPRENAREQKGDENNGCFNGYCMFCYDTGVGGCYVCNAFAITKRAYNW